VIAVIGAGPCGLYVASRLHSMRLPVRVFTACKPSFHFESKKLSSWIQSSGVGGRALLWGGWTDLPGRKELESEWGSAFRSGALRHGEFLDCSREASRWLQVRPAPPSSRFSNLFLPLGYEPKRQAQRKFSSDSHWPFPIVKHAKVTRLLEAQGRVTGFEYRQETSRKKIRVEANEVILCASPFSTLSLLGGLSKPPPFLGQGISNHLVGGWIGVQPRSRKRLNPAYGFKKDRDGVFELKGPFPASELDPDWEEYEYYRIHFIGSMSAQRMKIHNFRVSGEWTWSARDRVRACRVDRKLKQELQLLSREMKCFRIQNPLDPSNIAHESGGAVLGKTVTPDGRVKNYGNLFVMDASVMPTSLRTYPTLSLLSLIEGFLRKKGDQNAAFS
jgi:hypothetical protein